MSSLTYCPFCNSEVEVDQDWAEKNERLFCGTCCKSFDFNVRKNNQVRYAPSLDENQIDYEDFEHYTSYEEPEEEEEWDE
jgi:transcription elongation factor Elf1